MPDFEQPRREPIIPLEQAAEYAADTGKVAAAVKALLATEGWKIFLHSIEKRRGDVLAKRDYQTIEAFQSDRTALDIVDDAIGEMDDLIEDAEQAQALFNNVGAEGQTPRTTASLSTEAREG